MIRPVRPIKLYPNRKGFNIRTMMNDPSYSARVLIDDAEGFELEPFKFVLGYTHRQRVYLPHRSRIASPGEKERAAWLVSASGSM